AHHRGVRREGDIGGSRGAPRDVGDDGRRGLGATGSHRGPRSVGARDDLSRLVADHDRGVGAADIDAEKDRHADVRPISDDTMPTITVTAVPSGTYHGQAMPLSQCNGKCGMTAPRTTGDMTRTLATIATITSRCRARGQIPPKM